MPENEGRLAGPAIMILSALIFGYFGFLTYEWSTRGPDGEFILFPALLGWTLKISAILFLAAAGLTFVKAVAGNLLYALTGVVGAGMFVVVAVMDTADQGHTIMPYAPVVLLLFAAWNGYGSWFALRSVLAGRAGATAGDGPRGP
ncbi:MAG: hypothetical protein ACYSWT_18300 [Planctomycetota bacterium]|jgi:hypothetical protein